MEHTPGPWEANKSIMGGDWVISTADHTTLIAREVRHFNAPLIAAVPELLEACQEVRTLLNLDEEPLSSLNRQAASVRLWLAITKATGDE